MNHVWRERGFVTLLFTFTDTLTHTNKHPQTLRFNLPPLHLLYEQFIPDILTNELVRKRFFRKGDVSERQQRKFKYSSTSATVGNFRVRENEKFFGFRFCDS